MKKIITSVMATGLLLGTTANAASAQTFDRDAAAVTEAEGVAESGSLLIVLLIAAAIAAGIVFLEDSEDADNLPTSP
ncbi:hypothetical protein [Aurantiacibacter marinus]|uniref:Ferrochelatase n=1 Tax=Aurantiacibacter marinus TaxID=874156 RepID=A0A0H0XP23_9SPHN|nr:hypothetical protein [Aurantiacibacter marinus]KLI63781.1 hypothetical protein AAV99_08680 [Aurantiacibacter marinus]